MTDQAYLRELAETVGDDLASREDVRAILLVGSVACGYADEFSDIDLQIIGSQEPGERTVEDIHIEWTPVTYDEIEEKLTGWADDAALYTYANAQVLYDRTGLGTLLEDYRKYLPEIRRKKLYAGWFHGTGAVFDARKAKKRSDCRAQVCSSVSAVEQIVALSYILNDRFPPYRSALFRDLPVELPRIELALSGDVSALETLMEKFKPKLRRILDNERVEKPYLFQPEFGPLL